MTVVKINALEIPPDAGDEIIKRFEARMTALADTPGFLGFELLRPTAETETRWFVYTRWENEASFEAWRSGDGARNAHARERDEQPGSADGADGDETQAPPQRPVSMGASLLEFVVEVSADASGA